MSAEVETACHSWEWTPCAIAHTTVRPSRFVIGLKRKTNVNKMHGGIFTETHLLVTCNAEPHVDCCVLKAESSIGVELQIIEHRTAEWKPNHVRNVDQQQNRALNFQNKRKLETKPFYRQRVSLLVATIVDALLWPMSYEIVGRYFCYVANGILKNTTTTCSANTRMLNWIMIIC